MCVIIHKPAGKEIKKEDLIHAATRNKDGFGYMYYDNNKDEFITGKFLFEKPEDLLEILKEQVEHEVCYHLRIRTHGKVSKKNCHPFKVLSKEKHGMDLYFMHNGVINGTTQIGEESDTKAFNRQILKPLLKANKHLLKTEAFKLLVEDFIGGSKLLFMTDKGEIYKFNEKLWAEHDGMSVSNTSYFPSKYQAPAKNTKNYCSGYPYDESYYTNHFKSIAKENNDKKGITCTFGKEELKVGDEVLMFHAKDTEYCQPCKIYSITSCAVSLSGIDTDNKDKKFYFRVPSFSPLPGNPDYFMLPKTTNVTPFKKTLITGKDEKKDSSIVSRKNYLIDDLEFDSHDNRYGGFFIENSLTSYEDISVLDVFEMEPQDRLNFYLDNIPLAFGMFQDLIELMVYQDIENGYLQDFEEST